MKFMFLEINRKTIMGHSKNEISHPIHEIKGIKIIQFLFQITRLGDGGGEMKCTKLPSKQLHAGIPIRPLETKHFFPANDRFLNK